MGVFYVRHNKFTCYTHLRQGKNPILLISKKKLGETGFEPAQEQYIGLGDMDVIDLILTTMCNVS